MVNEKEGLLDQGRWDDIDTKPALTISTKPTHKKRWSIAALRPALMTPRASRTPKPKLRPTAYLDGLRGFAAFLVYIHHHELWAHFNDQNAMFENGFGYEGKYAFATFPFVRVFFTGGHFAVTVFFIISGYVLSAKPLSLIQAGDFVKLGDNLASALFRRWTRLFIPVIATTFIYMTIWHAFGIWQGATKPQSNWRDEAWWWYAEFKNFSFVFRSGGDPWFSYNFHLWSIPTEFKGSIAIYTTLLAVSRATKKARLWTLVGLIFYFMYIADGAHFSMFIGGMLLCDLDLLAQKAELPRWIARMEGYKEFLYWHAFAIAFYLGGVPSHNQDVEHLRNTRGWYYLSFLKPQAVYDYKWFYLFFASMFLVSAVQRLRVFRIFFETRFCQYLGRISFSLYLVHGPVLWTLGDRIYSAVGFTKPMHEQGIPEWMNCFQLPMKGPMGLEVAFLVPHIILLPVTLYLAEIVTKAFDETALRFAAWTYSKTQARFDKL